MSGAPPALSPQRIECLLAPRVEEHFVFTGVKTQNGEYFDTACEIRKQLLARLMPHHEGETGCISKHLLVATMRLTDVGNKLQSEGQKDRYFIFRTRKLKLVGAEQAKTAAQCCDE